MNSILPALHGSPPNRGKARRSPGDCAGDDNDVEMDGETAADGDLDACQPPVILASAQKSEITRENMNHV
jgi:hypothetical protein